MSTQTTAHAINDDEILKTFPVELGISKNARCHQNRLINNRTNKIMCKPIECKENIRLFL